MSVLDLLRVASALIDAAIVGLVFGAAGRLVVADRDRAPLRLTCAIGFLAALSVNGAIRLLDGGGGFSWRRVLVQVVAATVLLMGVLLVRRRAPRP